MQWLCVANMESPYSKWQEIASNILPHQTARDRPDITALYFQLKLKELIKDIKARYLDFKSPEFK